MLTLILVLLTCVVVMQAFSLFNQRTQRRALSTAKEQLMATQADLQAALDKVTADVTAETTVNQSAITLLGGIKTQLDTVTAELAAAGVPQSAVDSLTALSTSIESNTASLSAAITANTPAAPPAP